MIEKTPLAKELEISNENEMNLVRNFEVAPVRCIITGEIDKCISVPLATGETVIPGDDGNPILDKEGNPRKVLFHVNAQFSEKGLDILKRKISDSEIPLKIKTEDEIQKTTPYQWLVVLRGGQYIYQYPAEGGENSFGSIHIPDVEQFWIVTKHWKDDEGLPVFGLLRDTGFVQVLEKGGKIIPLNLPFPNKPIWFQYYRRVTRRYGIGSKIGVEEQETYIQQILGWRCDDTIFEIAIEADGSWKEYKKEPLDSYLFNNG